MVTRSCSAVSQPQAMGNGDRRFLKVKLPPSFLPRKTLPSYLTSRKQSAGPRILTPSMLASTSAPMSRLKILQVCGMEVEEGSTWDNACNMTWA